MWKSAFDSLQNATGKSINDSHFFYYFSLFVTFLIALNIYIYQLSRNFFSYFSHHGLQNKILTISAVAENFSYYRIMIPVHKQFVQQFDVHMSMYGFLKRSKQHENIITKVSFFYSYLGLYCSPPSLSTEKNNTPNYFIWPRI